MRLMSCSAKTQFSSTTQTSSVSDMRDVCIYTAIRLYLVEDRYLFGIFGFVIPIYAQVEHLT